MKKNKKYFKYSFSSKRNKLPKVEKITTSIAKKMNLSEEQKDNLSIAVTEAVGNAIVHGNKENPRKKVFLEFTLKKNEINVSVKDQGEGFKPQKLTNPLKPENIMKENGRGIFILKSLADQVHFTEGGTKISFTMKLSP
ncbi:MAG: ATP-binding protein [bacterium]